MIHSSQKHLLGSIQKTDCFMFIDLYILNFENRGVVARQLTLSCNPTVNTAPEPNNIKFHYVVVRNFLQRVLDASVLVMLLFGPVGPLFNISRLIGHKLRLCGGPAAR